MSQPLDSEQLHQVSESHEEYAALQSTPHPWVYSSVEATSTTTTHATAGMYAAQIVHGAVPSVNVPPASEHLANVSISKAETSADDAAATATLGSSGNNSVTLPTMQGGDVGVLLLSLAPCLVLLYAAACCDFRMAYCHSRHQQHPLSLALHSVAQCLYSSALTLRAYRYFKGWHVIDVKNIGYMEQGCSSQQRMFTVPRGCRCRQRSFW